MDVLNNYFSKLVKGNQTANVEVLSSDKFLPQEDEA